MTGEHEERCWKVIHSRGSVESIYLVTAHNKKMAIDIIKSDTAEMCGDYRHPDCGWSAELFKPDPPYFLYAINKETGQMSNPTVAYESNMCIVCLGNATS